MEHDRYDTYMLMSNIGLATLANTSKAESCLLHKQYNETGTCQCLSVGERHLIVTISEAQDVFLAYMMAKLATAATKTLQSQTLQH